MPVSLFPAVFVLLFPRGSFADQKDHGLLGRERYNWYRRENSTFPKFVTPLILRFETISVVERNDRVPR